MNKPYRKRKYIENLLHYQKCIKLMKKPMQNVYLYACIFLIRVRCIITGDFSTKNMFKMSNRNKIDVIWSYETDKKCKTLHSQ